MAASGNNNNNQQQNNNPNNNAANNNNNNNNPAVINQNLVKTPQLSNGINGLNNNLLIQKQMLQQMQYQGELDELTSQEISLDLQHLIDDQFRDSEAFSLISDIVSVGSTNGIVPTATSAAAKALQQARQQQQQPQNTYRSQLAYMPQPVHTGANYTNSSDENSSVGSDSTTVKEEPIDPMELRRQAAAVANQNNGQYVNGNTNGNLYQNYAQNGNGNTFTTLTPTSVLHHQGLPHIGHLNGLSKHKQLLPTARKQQPKCVDKGTDEYRRRRERNNIAVRKSREKAKVRSREVEEKVKALLKEKDALMRRLEEMSQEVHLHKQIYLHLMSHNNPEIKQICTSVLNLVNVNDHGLDWSK